VTVPVGVPVGGRVTVACKITAGHDSMHYRRDDGHSGARGLVTVCIRRCEVKVLLATLRIAAVTAVLIECTLTRAPKYECSRSTA